METPQNITFNFEITNVPEDNLWSGKVFKAIALHHPDISHTPLARALNNIQCVDKSHAEVRSEIFIYRNKTIEVRNSCCELYKRKLEDVLFGLEI